MKPSPNPLTILALAALLALVGCTEDRANPDEAHDASADGSPTLKERASQAAANVKETGAAAMADAKETFSAWADNLSEKSIDLRGKVGDLLESAKTSTANLGDNAKAKMDELALLMPAIQEQAGKLKESSGDAAKAAGDKLHALMARAETLYRDVTGQVVSSTESSPAATNH